MKQEVHIDREAARVIVAEELEALRLAIISNMQRAGEVASGRTIDSLHVESTEQEGWPCAPWVCTNHLPMDAG